MLRVSAMIVASKTTQNLRKMSHSGHTRAIKELASKTIKSEKKSSVDTQSQTNKIRKDIQCLTKESHTLKVVGLFFHTITVTTIGFLVADSVTEFKSSLNA